MVSVAFPRRHRALSEKPGGEGPHNIKYVALIAERHSGSRWMEGVLAKYFRGKNIKVTPTLCTWKVRANLMHVAGL